MLSSSVQNNVPHHTADTQTSTTTGNPYKYPLSFYAALIKTNTKMIMIWILTL